MLHLRTGEEQYLDDEERGLGDCDAEGAGEGEGWGDGYGLDCKRLGV
jgi:hypothetical protein